MLEDSARLGPIARPAVRRWCSDWGVPSLAAQLRIVASSRLRTSLGLCAPTRGELRIASFLLDGPRELLLEVLCHEAAHAAAHVLHGKGLRPHGREWRALMEAAGYAPRARIPATDLDALAAGGLRRVLWLHRCPVCRAHRSAGRPVPEWRCGTCRGAGLRGDLVITRQELGGAPASADVARAL